MVRQLINHCFARRGKRRFCGVFDLKTPCSEMRNYGISERAATVKQRGNCASSMDQQALPQIYRLLWHTTTGKMAASGCRDEYVD
jgi:hypothetical protein